MKDHDVAFVRVSRAPLAEIDRLAALCAETRPLTPGLPRRFNGPRSPDGEEGSARRRLQEQRLVGPSLAEGQKSA
ncbi:MAG: hypothetical protein ACRD3V_19665 [Vicinamibacteria bacterium]